MTRDSQEQQSAGEACGRTVLVCEDDSRVRRLVTRYLEQAGFRVVVAGGAEHALSLAAEEPEPVDLLITDVVMPGMNGVELARTLRRRFGPLRTLLISGYASVTPASADGEEENFVLLRKPFHAADLLGAVQALLERD